MRLPRPLPAIFRRRSCRCAILTGSIFALLGLRFAEGASQTWIGNGSDGLWSTSGNWVSGSSPGGTGGTSSTDVATFNAPIANTWGGSGANPIVIDSGRNIGGINFDIAAGNYFIGSTGGNSLLLTSGGAIQILSTLTATNAIETINAPLIIQGTNGVYTLDNNSANGSGAGAGTLNIGGGIIGAASGPTVLTLSGSNTNANTISGIIGNGTATSVSLIKSGTGIWVLTRANTYTGGTTVDGGMLTLAFGTVSANILPSASALTLGGGTLSLSGTGTQTENGLSTTGDSVSAILLGSNETLTLGALTSVGTSSLLNFNTAAGGANGATVGTGAVVLTGQTAGSVINYGFTVTDAGGFGLATVNSSNHVIRLTSALLPTSGAGSATDYLINNNAGGAGAAGSSALIVSASESAKSITVDTTAASGMVTLNSGVVLSNNTWDFGGNGSNTWKITGSASGAGLMSVATGGAIAFNNFNSGAVTISAPILANGTNQVSVFGNGTLIFSGVSTYTGNTIVSGGMLQLPSGGSINTSSTAGGVFVGYNSGDNGTLSLTGGSVTSSSGDLGNSAGSSGAATVSSGSWTNSGALYVGYNGIGVLNVTGGAVSNAVSYLGYSAGSSGTATVSGGIWTNSNLIFVGYSGVGVLNIMGGAVTSPGGYIGNNTGANGTVTVSSGSWSNSGALLFGYSGAGVMNVTGGSVTSLGGYLGYYAGANGTVTVSGGTWSNIGALYVGDNGVGVLNLTGTGIVTVGATGGGTLILANASGSNGTLNLGIGGIAGTLAAGSVTGEGGTAVVNFNQTGGYPFAQLLEGTLSVNKLGAGATILLGSNSYTGTTTISAGELIAANASALSPSTGGAVTVATGAGLAYDAGANAPLGLHSTLNITGGVGTVLGGSIGSSATGAEIAVAGAAAATGTVQVNVFGISGVTPMVGTNTYTLLAGGVGSSLNGATYVLGTVYDNTNFTVGALTATATSLQVTATSASALTSAYWVGGLGGGANVWSASNGSTASNWAATPGGAVQALVPGGGANVIISATSPVTAPVAMVLGANMSIGGLTIADTVNGLGLLADGFALTVGAGGITMNANVPASSIGANVVLGASQAWTNNSANILTVSGVISGSNNLTKAGTGALILSGANTYTGATTVSAGTVTAGVASVGGVSGALGDNSALILANVAGATLNLAGFNTQIGSLTGGGVLGGNVTLGAATFTVGGDNTNPAAYAGVLSGVGGALIKIGTGALTMAGANTYTGGTTVDGGMLTLAFGTVSANILPSASALTLGGGTLSLSGTGAQTENGLSTTADSVSAILLGSNETLTLGALTSVGTSSLLNFNTAAGGANGATVGTGAVVLTGQTAGSVINYGFTVTDAGGFGLATVNSSNHVIRLTSALLPASGAGSATDYLINNNGGGAGAAGSSALVVSASESAKSITVDTTAASGVVTLNSGVVLSNNTWDFGGNGSNTWKITGSASGAGLMSVASGGAITFNNFNSGAVTISAPILANGFNQVSVFGNGTLIFSGVSTYTGNTIVSGGMLQLPSGGSINTSSTASVSVGYYSGDNGTLSLTGGSVTSYDGYIGYYTGANGTATVISGTWTTIDAVSVGFYGVGVLNLTGAGTVTVGSMGNHTLNLAIFAGSNGTLNLGTGGAAGTLNAGSVTAGTGTAVVNFNQTGGYTFAPQLAGPLTVNKLGAGTTLLTASNTYTGATTVSQGTLLVSGSISGSVTTVSGAGSTLGGIGTVGGVIVGSGAILEGGNGSGPYDALTSAGPISLTSGSVIELTLGPSDTHSSLVRTDGVWTFDSDQTFFFNLGSGAGTGTYIDLISGLNGSEPGLANVSNWTISNPSVIGAFSYDGAGDVDLTLSAIPEPCGAALLLAGVPLLGLRRRRARK